MNSGLRCWRQFNNIVFRQDRSCTHAFIISIIHVITQAIKLNVCIAVSLILKIYELSLRMNTLYSKLFITLSNEQLLKPMYAAI